LHEAEHGQFRPCVGWGEWRPSASTEGWLGLWVCEPWLLFDIEKKLSRAPIGGVSEISTTGVSEISTAGEERNGEGLLNLGVLGEVVTLWVRGFPDLVLTQKKGRPASLLLSAWRPLLVVSSGSPVRRSWMRGSQAK